MKENNSEEEPIYLEAPINVMTKVLSILTVMNFSELEYTNDVFLMYNPDIDVSLYIQYGDENKSIIFSQAFYIYDKQNNKTIKKYMNVTLLNKELYGLTNEELLNVMKEVIMDIKNCIKEHKKNFLKQ